MPIILNIYRVLNKLDIIPNIYRALNMLDIISNIYRVLNMSIISKIYRVLKRVLTYLKIHMITIRPRMFLRIK